MYWRAISQKSHQRAISQKVYKWAIPQDSIEGYLFLRFCRTWTKRMVLWCIRLTCLTLVCEVIRYRLVQVRQNLKKKKRLSSWWPAVAFLYLFLFHSLLRLTSFPSQYKNKGLSPPKCTNRLSPNKMVLNTCRARRAGISPQKTISRFHCTSQSSTAPEVDPIQSPEIVWIGQTAEHWNPQLCN